MKTVKLYGEKLRDQFSVAITGEEGAESFAIKVNFVEDNERKTGKLLLHSKENLHHKDINHFIYCFTGTIVIDGNRRPCMVSCQTEDLIVEIWMTIIEIKKQETFTTNISKTDFIKKCKEYCKSIGLKITENGNLKEGFPLFRNATKTGNQGTIRMNGKEALVINTEMYNNLFPIEKDNDVIFGEYIDEHLVRIYSKEEALLMGVTIC